MEPKDGATAPPESDKVAIYTGLRTLRIANGPDEVHHLVVWCPELRKYEGPA